MFRELLSIFRGNTPLQDTSRDFQRMLEITQKMVLEASAIFWEGKDVADRLRRLRDEDIEVNKLERAIRKQAATHLTLSSQKHDVPYNLLMMSLVKDVERLGDYAKNLAEVAELVSEPFPDSPHTTELRRIRDAVETFVKEANQVFQSSNVTRAKQLTVEHRGVTKRCDKLVIEIARSDFNAAQAVRMTLGARYYKRIDAHLLNVVSSIIMPLHKLDYFDEDFLEEQQVEQDE